MQRDVRRRRFLATFGAGTVSLIAGCTGDGNPDDDGTTAEDGTPTMTADEDDLMAVEGVGAVTAERFRDVVGSEFEG